MDYKIVGYRDYKFTPEDSNNVLVGTTLFVTCPKPNVVGLEASKLSVSKDKMGTYLPNPGDTVSVFFNQYGKVDAISKVKGV